VIEVLRRQLGDRYLVEDELGRGGMATVYRATDLRHRRKVAIKVLHPGIAEMLGIERFRAEIETTARLSHPHIVPIFDSGALETDRGPSPYYVMPVIEGPSLRHRLDQEGQLSVDEALAVCRDVASALSYAHDHGVIHRDVKPENILLTAGQALLTDFGIAKPASPDERRTLTATGFAVGTPSYMSPEQMAGETRLDGRSDLYALAIVLYEMLGGQLPFTGATPREIAARQAVGEFLPLATIRPTVPAALDAALRKALTPAPADRFPTVPEFVAALDRPTAVGGQRWRNRALAATVAVVGLGLILWLTQRDRPGAPVPDGRVGLALMPFRAAGELEQWGETLPDLLATTLVGTPGIRVDDPWALWRPLRSDAGAKARSPDQPEAERLAKRARADRYVLGSVTPSGGRLDLNIRIYGAGFLEPISVFTVTGVADSTAALAQRAAVEIITRVVGDDGPTAPRLGSGMTQSSEALKAYLAAREQMRRGQPDSADLSIGRALALDSTFVLAMVEAISIRSWVQFARGQPYRGLLQMVDRALELADSLPERHRLRLVARKASIMTNGAEAAAAWQRLIELDNTDVEAWDGLAYIHLALGWQYGVNPVEPLRATDRALALDSTYVPALFRRVLLSSTFPSADDARAMLARVRAIDDGSPLLRGARLGLEAVLATDNRFAAMVDSLAGAGPIEWSGAIRRLLGYRPDRALTLARRSRERATPGLPFVLAAHTEAALLTGIGRSAEADSLRRAGVYAGVPGLEQTIDGRTVVHALLGLVDSVVVRGAVERLTRLVPIDSAMALFRVRPVYLAAWLLGGYHAALGDTAVATAWATVTEQFPEGGSPATYGRAIGSDILSRLAERRGQADTAATLSRRAFELWYIHTENASDQDVEPSLRFRLAQSLAARGQRDSAAAIFLSLTPPGAWLAGITPRALVEAGTLAEQQGDRGLAARYFDHALQYWELGDTTVAAWRRRAAEGVARNADRPPFRFGRDQ
jgi:tRNA A-37 threonylcarbamoyl transferase component Bud32/tetratricopeptide (TPR) repeat protein